MWKSASKIRCFESVLMLISGYCLLSLSQIFSSFCRSTLNSEFMPSRFSFARIINDKAILSFALAIIFCNFSLLSAVKKIANTRIWHLSDFQGANVPWRCIEIPRMSLFLNEAWLQLSYPEKWHTGYFDTTSVPNPGFLNNIIFPYIKLTVVEDK